MAGRVFQQATEEIQTRVRIVMGRFHDRLMEPVIPIGVTVETLMVYGPRNKDGQQTGQRSRSTAAMLWPAFA